MLGHAFFVYPIPFTTMKYSDTPNNVRWKISAFIVGGAVFFINIGFQKELLESNAGTLGAASFSGAWLLGCYVAALVFSFGSEKENRTRTKCIVFVLAALLMFAKTALRNTSQPKGVTVQIVPKD